MIKGAVNDRYEAVITITILTSTGGTRDIETVVDTGYNGFLLLPTELVGDLQLPFLNSTVAVLANDEAVTLHTHQAEIVWDGQTGTVRATCPASTILADLASISFAGSPPRLGPVAGPHQCGSWGRQTRG